MTSFQRPVSASIKIYKIKIKLDVGAQAHNPSVWEDEAEWPLVKGQHGLSSEFDGPHYIVNCLRKISE